MSTEIVDDNTWQAANLQVMQQQQQQQHQLSENPAFLALQQEALEDFLSSGFPTRKTEAWKYTPVAKIANSNYSMVQKKVNAITSESYTDIEAHQVVFCDGKLQKIPSSLPVGVQLMATGGGLKPLDWLRHLKLRTIHQTPFTQLNTALMTEGLFLYVPKGVVLDKPIHVCYHQTEESNGSMQHPRHLIVADASSEVTLIEEYSGDSSHYLNNVVTQIIAYQSAVVKHIKIQRESCLAEHIASTVIKQHRDSAVTSFAVSLGACLARENLSIDFIEEAASASLYGLYLPEAKQHIDHHTRVDHAYPNCFSDQLYKGIVAEQGCAVFNGKVHVHKEAQKTVAHQNNKNLLLSDHATINAKPELEIYADDVKCSHGATVGQLDQKALFYLRSRGIDILSAKYLLTSAFTNEIVEKVLYKPLVDHLKKLLERKFQTAYGE